MSHVRRITNRVSELRSLSKWAVEDEAKPFDPLQLEPRPQPTSLDEARPAGRGIVLMRSSADATSYERLAGRNRLTLRFVIPG